MAVFEIFIRIGEKSIICDIPWLNLFTCLLKGHFIAGIKPAVVRWQV